MAKTPKARALSGALQAARVDRKITLRDLAARIERDPGVLSRYETGGRTPKPDQVAQILTALGIAGEEYNEIMSLARGTDDPTWVATSLPEQRQQLAAVVAAEQEAEGIGTVSPLLIPGMLQTNETIQAIMSGASVPPKEAATRLSIRVGRRDLLTREKPIQLTAYIGEAALRQVVGDPVIQLGQLRYLLEIGDRPNVRIRIVKFHSGWHPGLEGAFQIIDPHKAAQAIVHIENRKSGIFVHEPEDVRTYLDAINRVRDVAEDEAESRKFITGLINSMERK